MRSWRQTLRDASISGTCAALASTVALTLCGAIERGEAVAPNNGPSQWLWGEQEAYERRATLRHTLAGFVIHHLMSVFWALIYEVWTARATSKQPTRQIRPRSLARACGTAGLACFVDYCLTPRRLRPGFEKHLSKGSLALVYVAFGLGLRWRPVRSQASPLHLYSA